MAATGAVLHVLCFLAAADLVAVKGIDQTNEVVPLASSGGPRATTEFLHVGGRVIMRETAEHLKDPSHGGGEGGEGRSSREAVAYTYSLLGSIVLLMSFVYVMQVNEGGFRHCIWEALNLTVSVFCAVLIYGCIKRCLDGFAPLYAGGDCIGIFLVMYVFVQGVLYALRDKHNELIAIGTLFGHVTGFGAMYGVAEILWDLVGRGDGGLVTLLLVTLGAAVLLLLLFAASEKVRQVLGTKSAGSEAWLERVAELENDVLSLTLGFAVTQAICYAVAGRLLSGEPAEEPESPTQRNANVLLGIWIIMTVGLFAFVNFCHHHLQGRGERVARTIEVLQSVFSTAKAWAILTWGHWQVYALGFEGVRLAACMLVALGMTGISIGLIFGLNRRLLRLRRGQGRTAVRYLSLSMGVIIGFSWETAFDVALETLSHNLFRGSGFRGFSVYVFTLVSLVVVLPAWSGWILPKCEEHIAKTCSS